MRRTGSKNYSISFTVSSKLFKKSSVSEYGRIRTGIHTFKRQESKSQIFKTIVLIFLYFRLDKRGFQFKEKKS